MRELKFRAWDKTDKFMSKPFTFSDFVGYEGEGGAWVFANDIAITNNKKLCDIKIMQYTGIKDKNGEEIYEGDIVETFTGWWMGKETFHRGPVHYNSGEVGPCKGDNVMEWLIGDRCNLWDGEDVEIVGNIYEM